MIINRLFRLLGQFCLLVLLLIGPWRNGGRDASTVENFLYLTTFVGIFALLTLWTTPYRERQKFVYFPTLVVSIPLFLGLVLCIVQVIPFSSQTLAKLSPKVLELKKVLLPPNSNISFEDFCNKDSKNNLIKEIISEETIQVNSEFLHKSFPSRTRDDFDLSEALALDSVIQHSSLSQNQDSCQNLIPFGNCVSVYPTRTRQWIVKFWCALVVFLSSAILFNTSKSRLFLLYFILVFGSIYALLCIITRVNPSGLHVGFFNSLFEKYHPVGSYGFFSNKNACAGYLVLLLSSGISLTSAEFLKSVYWIKKERTSRSKHDKQPVNDSDYDYEFISPPRWKLILGNFFDLFNKRFLISLSLTVVIFSAILISLSRGATVAASTVLVIVSSICFLFKKETRRYWYLFPVPIIFTFGVLLATSSYDAVDARMSTLVEEDEKGMTAIEQDSRWDNWHGAMDTSKEYFWIGSGLGTYYLSNRTNDIALKHHKLFYYAENVFVQTLVELGIIGLILLIIEYILLVFFLGRLLLGRHSFEGFALSLGAIALLLGHIITSCCDYACYLPTNLILFATLCGVCLGRTNLRKWNELFSLLVDNTKAQNAVHQLNLLRKKEKRGCIYISLALIVCLIGALAIYKESSFAVKREQLLEQANNLQEDKLPYLTENGLDGLINEFEKFVKTRDDSYEIREALASLYVKKYRLHDFSILTKDAPNVSPQQVWKETEILNTLVYLLQAQKVNFKVPPKKIRSDPAVVEILSKATYNYLAARLICPLHVESNRLIIKTLPLTTNLSLEEERLLMELYCKREISFVPWDSFALFKHASFLAFFNLQDLQQECYNRTLQYTIVYRDSILTILDSLPNSNIEQTINLVMPNSPQIAFEVFERVCVSFKDKPIYDAIEKRLENILNDVPQADRNARFYYMNAVLNEHQKKYEEADAAYLKAIKIEPNNTFYGIRRAKFLNKYRNILEKDEECLRFLQKLYAKTSGQNRWECQKLIEITKKNVMDLRARKRAQERIIKEREMDKRIQEKEDRIKNGFIPIDDATTVN